MKQGWETKSLKDVGDIFSGNSINATVKKNKYLNKAVGLPYIATKDIGYDSFIDYENGVKIPFSEKDSFRIAPKNSVLLCAEGGSAGRKIGRTNQDICFVNKLFALATENEITSKFVFYWYHSVTFQKDFKSRLTGLIGGVSKKKFETIPIPIPPIPEQKRIVKILDEAFAAIDKAKANAEKNLQNSRELFDSYLNKVFANPSTSRGTGPGEDWEEKKLGKVCDFVRGPFGGSLKKQIFVEDGYAVFEQSHAIYNQFEKIRYFINDDKFKEMSRFEIKPGNLIMSCSGTMGKVSIVPGGVKQGIINQALLLLKPNGSLFNKFLKYWIESDSFQESLKMYSQGAAIQNVASVKTLKEIQIHFPSLPIQKKIVKKLDEISSESKKLETIYQQKLADLEELKKSILQKAFDGELARKN